ncbi:MAG: arsenate reductase ArsC, partial [Thermoanaerobaculia bacterium]|nr:arsenate reductase ArsC [Thermoanaerobaculia bacterium]
MDRPLESPNRRRKVLFLCTGNSARSILGEYLLRDRARGRFEVHSAGSDFAGEVHPLARRVLEVDYGIDTSTARSEPVDEVRGIAFDLVITVCDSAREACPAWLGGGIQVHWGLEDPAAFEGSEEERLEVFRRTAELLEERIERLLDLPPESWDQSALEEIHRASR